MSRWAGHVIILGTMGPIAGCTTLLGIDGEYMALPEAGIDSGGADAGVSGDALPDAGPPGVADSGDPVPDADPSPADASRVGDAATSCMPGRFEGEFEGYHRPSTIIPFFPVPLTQIPVHGDVVLLLEEGEPGSLRVAEESVFRGVALYGLGSTAEFDADLTGTVSCSTGELTGALENGRAVAPPAQDPWFEFEGTLEGSFSVGRDALTGRWEEAEVPSVPTAGGEGTWSVRRVSP